MLLFGLKTAKDKDSYAAIVEAAENGTRSINWGGQEISLEEAIGMFADEEMAGLFKQLAKSLVSQFANADTDEKEIVKHRYRTSLGPRYGSLLLTSISLKEVTRRTFEKDPAAISLRACVEESLQWHREAVFAEGLIYYVDDQSNEELLHECVVVKLDLKVNLEQPMHDFLEDLKRYVRQSGSSVRTKAHLRLIRFPEIDRTGLQAPKLKSVPLPTPNQLDPKDYDELLDLPDQDGNGNQQDMVGDQNRFREIVRQHLDRSLRLEEDFQVVHYSAGSDSIGDVKDDVKVRATAHLYVIFQKKMGEAIALDYTIAMRETLGRLTVAFALERMRVANDELQRAQEREEERHRNLQVKVRDLAEKIQGLQLSTYEVMTLVAPSVWQSLRDWVGVIGTLSESKFGGKFTVPGLRQIPSKHVWKEEQYAAALLSLVNYKGKPGDQLKTAEQAWNSEKVRVCNNAQDFSTEHPMWRSLDRLGVLNRDLNQLSGSAIGIELLKDAFYDKGASFEANGFTILCLLLAVGADIDANRNGTSRKINKSTEIMLVQTLRADIVIDGLNMIHDTLTEKKICGLQHVVLQFDESEDRELWFSIRFKNKRVAEFGDLCSQVARIKSAHTEKHPGYRRHDMSMSILTALGVNEENWAKDLSGIEIGQAEMSFAPKSANECIARCHRADDFLVMSYKTRASS